MVNVILALLLGGSLYYSLAGVAFATNIIIVILLLSVVLTTYSIVILGGFHRTILMSAQEHLELINTASTKTNFPVIILLRGLLTACVWHLYTLGFVFFAGVAATTVTISLVITIFMMIDNRGATE
jgi:hypothetical protein